jgi:ATP-dependent Clp endopeptidase proteolytic subunit ClpP
VSASWYDIRNITDKAAEVAIYDEIGLFGVTAKEFSNSLKGLSDRRLTVRIHSPGGEIFEGNAVYNLLRRHKGGVDVAIDGLAASMASVIAMAGEKRSMAENAMLMIHNPWTVTMGDSESLRKEADLMDTLKQQIISAYAGRTGMKREVLDEMMDEETWLTATEAKEFGFVTDITEPLNWKNSVKRFDISRFSNTPKSLMDSMPTPEELPVPENSVENPEEIIVELEESLDEFEGRIAGIETSYQSALSAKDAVITAKDALILARDQEIASLKAKIDEVAAEFGGKLERLEKLAGVAPAEVVVPAPKTDAKSLRDQFEEMPDGPARTAFYNKHSQEILASVQKA